jgi:hypothetical protein
MAQIIRSKSAKPHTPEDVFTTTAQIRKKYQVTDPEIHELERKGYLTHFFLNRKAKRYWRADVEAGVHAFVNDLPAPSPTYKHRASINWEV